MRVRDLLDDWQKASESECLDQEVTVRLTRHEAAKISALAEMFPGKGADDIVRELIAAALNELEATMPYIPGATVVSEDEHGDPIYEDVGPTPRFKELTRKHLERLES